MVKNHLKTLAAPRNWKLERRTRKYTTKPNPGTHSMEFCVPLNFVLRDMLDFADTNKEVKKILMGKHVLVDGIRRKELKFPVGIFDTFAFEDTKEYFRMVLNGRGMLSAVSIDESESRIKPCRIIGKTVLRKGRVQINLYDGKNLIVDKGEFKPGDTAILTLPDCSIKKHLKLEKGALVFFTGGKHRGSSGTIDDIKGDKIAYKNENGETIETLKKYAFVIGKEKPEIKLK